MQMHKAFVFIIDIFFPPSEKELLIRSLSPENFEKKASKAPPPPYSFIFPLFAYKDPLVRELVWQIKYKKNRHAARIAAYALYKKLSEFSCPITLIPIPISKKRRRERGYNQCELIIDEIITLDSEKRFAKNYELLVRSKHIERQTLKGRAERIEDAKNIFTVTETAVTRTLIEEKIILIDDVVTTGSTAKEARETLLRAGYEDVQTITVAH